MNSASLMKRAPTLIMVVSLTYACYKIHAILPGAGAGGNELAKGLDVMLNDALKAGAEDVRALSRDALRDPFRAKPKTIDASKSQEVTASDPDKDALAELVQGLSLDATFLQGKSQIAIISGRMYHQGQHLLVQADGGKTYSPLYVENVQVQRVTLMAHNKRYELAYPDKLGNRAADRQPGKAPSTDGSIAEIDPEGELAFFKQLANSPLGKLGKGLIGIPPASTSPSKARPSNRSAR
jgi:hypothetical protein